MSRARSGWDGGSSRILSLLAVTLAAAVVLVAGLAPAADYVVTDQASCEAFLAAVGTTGSWAAGPACAVAGTIPADAHLTASGGVTLRLANLGSTPSSLTNLGTITVNATSGGTVVIAGDLTNSGTFEILATSTPPSNLGSLFDEGTFVTDVVFFNSGYLQLGCRGKATGPIVGNPLVFVCPEPTYPVASDVRACQKAIATAGGQYLADRHKGLVKCRSALLQGKPVFANKAMTVPVTSAAACPQEFKARKLIARSRRALRDAVAGKCTDATVATLGACALTVDGLATPDATAGCLITDTDASVASQLKAEYGY